jgi:hypothetical protein
MKQFRSILPFFVFCAVLTPVAINTFATCPCMTSTGPSQVVGEDRYLLPPSEAFVVEVGWRSGPQVVRLSLQGKPTPASQGDQAWVFGHHLPADELDGQCVDASLPCLFRLFYVARNRILCSLLGFAPFCPNRVDWSGRRPGRIEGMRSDGDGGSGKIQRGTASRLKV